MKSLLALASILALAAPLLAQNDDNLDRALEEAAKVRGERRSGAFVPGSRVGSVKLGQNRAGVRAALGRAPDAHFALSRGYSSDLWKWSQGDNIEIFSLETLYQGGRVVQIEVICPQFVPAGVEDSAVLADWLKKFGSAERTSVYAYNARRKGTSRQKYLDWPSRGFALETRRSEGEDYLQTAIVHRKGARGVVDFDGQPITR
jgi:hypothetical protein